MTGIGSEAFNPLFQMSNSDTEILGAMSLAETTVTVAGRVWTLAEASSPDALVARVETDADLQAFPYGLLLWPSALALAEHLTQQPRLVRGRRVLELGAGVGLPGLVARDMDGLVTQTDYQPAPLALARRNAQRNGITDITWRLGDWRDFPPLPPFDVVLGSDVLYERGLHTALRTLLPGLVAPHGVLLLSDPMRPPSAVFVDALERDGWRVGMESKTVAWRGEPKEIALFTAGRP